MRSLVFDFLVLNVRKSLLSGLTILVLVVSAWAEEPVNNSEKVQSELQKLELSFHKTILEIDAKEKEMVQEQIEICRTIQQQLKADEEKKPGGKLSKKKRAKLLQQQAVNCQTIDMIKQLNVMTREAKKKEYEKEVEKVFARHDVYLSDQ